MCNAWEKEGEKWKGEWCNYVIISKNYKIKTFDSTGTLFHIVEGSTNEAGVIILGQTAV